MIMTSVGEIKIKEEAPPEDDYILVEDEIKVEEPCLQYSDNINNQNNILASVVIEQKLSICSMCKCAFERKSTVKLHNQSDIYKCNKCILHSRLSEVFTSKKKRQKGGRKRKVKTKPSCDNIPNDEAKSDSVLIKRVMYICTMCKAPFERKDPIKFQHESDWLKCNKCILHSRLSKVFNFGSGKCGQKSKLPI